MAENDEPREALRQEIFVNSGYGYNTRAPFVSLRVKDVAVMFSPDEAREIGSNLLRCAEAAEGDGFLVEFFMGKFDLEIEHAAGLLREFRIWREERRKGGTSDT